ncbi:hypothetical protein ElyMa_000840800, partial [Elysia marginata]
TNRLPWVFWSKSLLSTIRPTRYPGYSGPKAYCLLLTNTLPSAFRSKSLLSTSRPTRYPGPSGPRAYFLPLDQHATLGLPVQEPTVQRRPTRYPVSSSPRAYCLSLDRHSTLGFPVQKPTVYHLNRTRSWAFQSKSLLSTARPARYPGLSGLRAYCLPLDRHDTLDFAVQEHTVYR